MKRNENKINPEKGAQRQKSIQEGPKNLENGRCRGGRLGGTKAVVPTKSFYVGRKKARRHPEKEACIFNKGKCRWHVWRGKKKRTRGGIFGNMPRETQVVKHRGAGNRYGSFIHPQKKPKNWGNGESGGKWTFVTAWGKGVFAGGGAGFGRERGGDERGTKREGNEV